MEPDLSELEELHFECIEICGLCCLCQPELLGDENKQFAKDPELKKGITRQSIVGTKTKNYSLKLKEGRGSCYFLSNRRCTIYNKRPYYCRMFPFHVHVGTRPQVVGNLSCRGFNRKGRGVPAVEAAQEALDDAKEQGLEKALKKIKKKYKNFQQFYIEPEDVDLDELKAIQAKAVENLGFELYVQSLMAITSMDDEDLDMAKMKTILSDGLKAPGVKDAALQGALDTFGSEELTKLPVWADEEFNWTVCRIVDGQVEQCHMGDDGGLKIVNKIPLAEVELLKLDDGGNAVLTDYAKTLIGRDLLEGYCAYLLDYMQEDDSFLIVYLGALGTLLLDLWWRASLLAGFDGSTTIDHDLALHGIRAYDMDLLDLPSLGGFI